MAKPILFSAFLLFSLLGVRSAYSTPLSVSVSGRFASESGFSHGGPVPEFQFSVPQIFSGTTSAPTFALGNFAVSEWVYSDATNYDDELDPNSIVAVLPAPEPSTLLFVPLAVGSLAPLYARWKRLRHMAD